MKKPLFKSDLEEAEPKHLTEADILNIAVKSVGPIDIRKNRDSLKEDIKYAYGVIKEIAEEL